MNDTPAASHRSWRKYLLNSVDSLARVGLKFLVASFESRLNFDFRKEGGAVRDIAVHTDDILGRGVPDALSKTRVLSEYRAWPLGAQEKSFMCVGAGFPEENDSSVELTWGPSPNNLKPVLASPGLRASRPRKSPPTRSRRVSESWEGLAACPPSLCRIFALDWRALHEGPIRCKAVIFSAPMIWSE